MDDRQYYRVLIENDVDKEQIKVKTSSRPMSHDIIEQLGVGNYGVFLQGGHSELRLFVGPLLEAMISLLVGRSSKTRRIREAEIRVLDEQATLLVDSARLMETALVFFQWLPDSGGPQGGRRGRPAPGGTQKEAFKRREGRHFWCLKL